jgi:hypothetical protein
MRPFFVGCPHYAHHAWFSLILLAGLADAAIIVIAPFVFGSALVAVAVDVLTTPVVLWVASDAVIRTA